MIPQIQPWIGKEELDEVTKAIKSTWVTEHSEVEKFTESVKEVTGAKYVQIMDHGTSALHLGVKALGIGPGDEVLVPDITFGATANAVLYNGAKPVFVDVDKNSLINIDPSQIEQKITKNTKAILPVHLYGYAADMDKIMEIAKKHNLYVIEDAAQAIGVTYKGKHVGTFGDWGILSFYGNKTVTTGEGGALLTNSEEIFSKVRLLSHEGRIKGSWVQQEVGYNNCFTDIQAAIGVAQLSKLSRIIENKTNIYKKYFDLLSGIKRIRFIPVDSKVIPTYWMTVIFVDDARKLSRYLLENGVQTRDLFYPLHMQPSYEFLHIKEKFPMAEKSYNEALALPSSATLSLSDVEKISKLIRSYFK